MTSATQRSARSAVVGTGLPAKPVMPIGVALTTPAAEAIAPASDVAGHARELVHCVVVCEHEVGVERDLGEVRGARRVPVRRVDDVAHGFRQRKLRGGDDGSRARGVRDAAVDLEVDMRPAA